MENRLDTLLAAWGIASLYPYQEQIIRSLLDHDEVLQAVILPTGAGKSLCFQLPAALLPHPTLVIYPLRSLSADQKRRCDRAGLSTVVLQGGQTRDQRRQIRERLESGTVQMVLTNPETLEQPLVAALTKSVKFSHAVVDEAHCVELWGTSFRPSYRRVASLLEALNVPRITAFSATASPRIAQDWAQSIFGGREFTLVRASADRPNLDFVEEPYLSIRKSLPRLLVREQRPAVVFCRSREQVRKWAHHLHRTTAFEVRFYHAGLSRDEKASVEAWFLGSNSGILLATNAYGMGVDKPNIRTVVHLDRAPSPEDYLQEAGRAGRDGKPARALLLVPSRPHLPVPGCRRAALLQTLGEDPPPCAGCDVCRGQASGPPLDAGAVLRRLGIGVRRFDRNDCLAYLSGRWLPRDWDSDLPRTPGWGLWKDEDDLTIGELWSGLEKGGWVRFYEHGLWKGLLAPLEKPC